MQFFLRPALIAGFFLLGGLKLWAQTIEAPLPEGLRYKQTKASMRASLEIDSTSSNSATSDTAALGLEPRIIYGVTPDSWALLNANLKLSTGRSQDILPSENQNFIELREASYNLLLAPQFTFGAGAVSQRDLSTPLLLDEERAFLGAREKWEFSNDDFQGHIQFQQNIPTSKSLSSENIETEATPYLFTETAKLNWSDRENFSSGRITHFRFKDLPRSVAGRSATYGNTVDDLTDQYGTFRYGFEGYEVFIEAGRDFEKHRPTFGVSYLVNSYAAENRNKGQMVFGAWMYRLSNNLEIEPKLERIVNQSDSSPAAYNNSEYRNNQAAWRGSLKVFLPRYDLKLQLSYLKGQPINPGPLAFEQESVAISLETNYADL